MDRKPLLESLADHYIIPQYTEWHTAAFALNASIEAFVEDPNEERLEGAREKFHAAYKSWQSVGFLDFGPAFTHTLRANVNSFPTDNFSIENAVESGTIALSGISAQNKKGLPALDYLLYGIGETPAEVTSQYITAENAANRKAYLAAVAEDIFNQTDKVYHEWLPAEGNFKATFISRDGTDVGSSIGQMVNSLSQYLERFTRDARVGIPLGKRSQGTIIPRNVEAYYSGHSSELATDNVAGIKNFYMGSDGIGFYGFLEDLQAGSDGQLAERILAQLDAAVSHTAAMPSPLSDALEQNPGPVDAAHAELQKLVIIVKTEMPSALGVLITYQDNDGD